MVNKEQSDLNCRVLMCTKITDIVMTPTKIVSISLAICNFSPPQKVWKFLIQIQVAKSNPKITCGVKVPCLMQVRVKFAFLFFTNYHVQGRMPAVLEWGRAVQQDVNFLGSMIAKNPLT